MTTVYTHKYNDVEELQMVRCAEIIAHIVFFRILTCMVMNKIINILTMSIAFTSLKEAGFVESYTTSMQSDAKRTTASTGRVPL